jgi:cytochrome c556
MKKATLFLLCLLAVPMLQAQDFEAQGIIKYRQAVMTSIKGHNLAIKQIVTGQFPDNGQIPHHVEALGHLFAELDSLFPEGSDFGKTNAKDEIWENPQKFATTIKKARAAYQTFKMAANGSDHKTLGKALKAFGKSSCGSCHKSFKKKPKK